MPPPASPGLLDQETGATRSTYLRLRRVQRHGAGRVFVGEPPTATDELHPAGLPCAGVGGVFQERSQRLGKLGDPVTAGSWRSASHGAGCMTSKVGPEMSLPRLDPGSPTRQRRESATDVRLDGDEMAADADDGDAGHATRTYI
jgi:hypothetical protein